MGKNHSDKRHQHSEKEKLAAVDKLHKTDKEASLKGDFDTLITLLTNDCVLIPPDRAPIAGKTAIQKYFDEQKKFLCGIEIIEYRHDFKEIKILGDWAYEWGYFSNTAKSKGGEDRIKGRGKIFRILELQDNGSWKVARSIWNISSD